MDPYRIAVGSTEIEIILSCEQVDSHLEFLAIQPRHVAQGQVSKVSFQGKGIITFPCKVDDDTDVKDYYNIWEVLLDTINKKKEPFHLTMWLENFDFLRKKIKPFLESMVKALCWLGQKKDNNISSVYIVAGAKNRMEFTHEVILQANQSAETILCRNLTKMKEADGVIVEVILGKLHEQKHDVLVNNASLDMDLSNGVVSKALLGRAGSGMQREAKAKYKNGLHFGDVGSTGGYSLLCKQVFHAILMQWDISHDQNDLCLNYLSDVVTKCLKMADGQKFKSIAFPALGTGRLSIPEHIAARTMFRAIEDYVRHNESKTTIERITIVIYDTCLPLRKTFESELQKSSLMKPKKQAENRRSLPPLPDRRSAPGSSERKHEQQPGQYPRDLGKRNVASHDTGAIPKTTQQDVHRRKRQKASPDFGEDNEDGKDKENILDQILCEVTIQLDQNATGYLPPLDQIKKEVFTNMKVEMEVKSSNTFTTKCWSDYEKVMQVINGQNLAKQRTDVGRKNPKQLDVAERSRNTTNELPLSRIPKDKEDTTVEKEQMDNEWFGDMSPEDLTSKIDEETTSMLVYEAAKNKSEEEKVIPDISYEQHMALFHFFAEALDSFERDVDISYKSGKIVLQGKNHSRLKEADLCVKKALTEIQDFTFCPVDCENKDPSSIFSIVEDMKAGNDFDNVCVVKTDGGVICVGNNSNAVVHFMGRLKGILCGGSYQAAVVRRQSVTRPKRNIARAPTRLPKNYKQFITAEGITVYVYEASIVNVHADCIVCTTNSKLEPVGKVATLISKEAGPPIQMECQNHIERRGSLRRGQACVTSAGNLDRYRCVIHTVGPNMRDYDEGKVKETVNCLHMAIFSCLLMAQKEQCFSIAIPSISAGKHGLPKKVCATQYCMGVLDFSATQRTTHLKEIHFVDVNKDMVHIIELTFASLLEGNRDAERELMGSGKLKKLQKQFDDMKRIVKKKLKPKKPTQMQIHEQVGNMLMTVKKDCALVCGQDSRLECRTKLTKEIDQREYRGYSNSLSRLKAKKKNTIFAGGVFISATKQIRCEKIYTLVVQNVGQLTTSGLEMCYKNVLQKAAHECKAVAFQLLGLKRVSIETSTTILCDTVLGICREIPKRKLTDVYIIDKDANVIARTKSIVKDANKSLSRQEYNEVFKHTQEHLKDVGDRLNKQPKQRRAQPQRPPPPVLSQTSSAKKTNDGRITNRKDANDSHAKQPTEKRVDLQSPRRASTPISNNTNSNEAASVGSGMSKDTARSKPLTSERHGNSNIENKSEQYDMENVMPKSTEELSDPEEVEDNPESSGSDTDDEDAEQAGEEKSEDCPICIDTVDDPKVLEKCGHTFCTACITEYFKIKPVCPICGTVYGNLIGNQPEGTMKIYFQTSNLPGFSQYGTICVEYRFSDGTQVEGHPCPGEPYKGTRRTAYLPDSPEGRVVLSLLKKAFDQKLVFTIGRSVTTGQEGVVTWNDIHHKTKTHGGAGSFGYPDPTYLSRVKEELAAKGITQ